MLSLRVMGYWAIFLLMICGMAGCSQSDSQREAEADRHFQKGRALADSEDYKGAAEEFESALQDNPQSGAAHFELGWLYDTKLKDYAAGIYHYERHLLYEPDSKRADLVRERIRGCKEELANSEFLLPNMKNMQRDNDRLTVENQSLKKEVEALNKELATATAQAQVAQAQIQSQPVQTQPVEPTRAQTPDPQMPGVTPIPPLAHPRYHVVQPHETFSSIAAASHIRVSLLMAANPRINPRRLRVGQKLNLP
jgi:LysM repeat protein